MRKILLFLSLFLLPVGAWGGQSGCNTTINGYGFCKQDITDYNGIPSAPSISNLGQARMYYDSTQNELELSANGGTYAPIGSGSGSGLTVGTTTIANGTNGYVEYNNNGVLGEEVVSGTGTVTSVSVATANGFSGTVANASTTPAITMQTSITGILKGNGTSISAATSGTDYQPALSLLAGTYTNNDLCVYASSGTLLNCNLAQSTFLTPTGSAASLTSFPTLNQNTTGNAATATTAGTVTTAAQPAITSVGTLSSLTMGGTITGKNSGYVDYSSITCGNSVTAGTAVGTGTTPSYTAPTAGNIISATITGSLSAGNCSCVVDIWKANAALPTVANTITDAAYPTLSTSTYSATTLTGWTTSIAANDVIMCNVSSCTCDNWNVVLGVQK